MLTVAQIISQADLRFPNQVEESDKIIILNSIQRELFRTIYKKKTFTSYDIIADNAFYPLDFDISKVISVLVNDVTYTWEENNDREAESPYAYAYENSVVLYPTPDEDIDEGLKIWHYEEPTALTEESTPDFDGDFHMILVYLLAKELAEIAGKDDRASYFQVKANEKIKDFEKTNPEPVLSDIGLA